MAKIWKERVNPEAHREHMRGAQDGGYPISVTPSGFVFLVQECGFTFQFTSVEQIREAHAYFSQKVHPTRRVPGITLEHYWKLWHERLPPGLIGGTKRTRCLKALERALELFNEEQLKPRGS